MARVHLIHWKSEEAQPRIATLEAAGHEVITGFSGGAGAMRKLRENEPDAFVIDLTRMPSHGRDVALALRGDGTLRMIPIVFAEGDPAKVAKIRDLLPDAMYTTWRRIRGALKKAIANPPADPVVPASKLAGYSGTPLPKKLGIKPGFVVALVGAPDDFAETLGDLPEGATLRWSARGKPDLILWFNTRRSELERRIERMAALAWHGPLWIVWPKKASGVQTDVSEPVVRRTGLDAGLVDYKICAVDATWSGLLFTPRDKRKKGKK